MTDHEIQNAARAWRHDKPSLAIAALCVLVVGLALLLPVAASAETNVREVSVTGLDFDEVACTNSSICDLTDLVGARSIMIQNLTDQRLCVEVTSATTCGAVTITCAASSAGTDGDLFTLAAGETATLPLPLGYQLCGKLSGAIGNGYAVRTTETS